MSRVGALLWPSFAVGRFLGQQRFILNVVKCRALSGTVKSDRNRLHYTSVFRVL